MSELQPTLELFGFTSIDDLTTESLKKAFKTHIIKSHPDKGGDPEVFDKILAGYVYLTVIIQRITGGRATLQTIVTPDELKEMRVDEIINRIFEEFDNDTFNEHFEKENTKEVHGYDNWLKEKNDSDNLIDGEFGDATQKAPTFDEKDFHDIFFKKAKEGKSEPTAIILHPEQMAYVSGQNIGTSIIETTEGGYSSDAFANPEFTDVYNAFTTSNILYDKLPTFVETNKSFDELIVERNKEITPFNDTELQVIQEYEKLKLEKNINNLSKIKEYFEYDGKRQTNLTNWPPEKYSNDEYKGFIVDL